jgi:HAD superfamily hydrolase (TIGR01509 family)
MRSLLLIFDFDNTLEEFTPFEEAVENDIFQKLGSKHLIDPAKMKAVFDSVKSAYAHPRAEPNDYGRHVWFSQTFHIFHIHEPVQEWVKYYWDQIFSLVRVYPGVYEVLQTLKEQHTLCILSDSDGDVQIKLQRIEQLGLTKYFDTIYTSDTAGHNKPHPRTFLQVLEHYKVAAEDCVMIGDSPHIDLVTAKELGMTTVWQRQACSKLQRTKHYEYVDYEIDAITELSSVIQQIAAAETPLQAAVPKPI